jgi:hypothetical protein
VTIQATILTNKAGTTNTPRFFFTSEKQRRTTALCAMSYGAIFLRKKRQYFRSLERSNDDPNPSLGNRNVLHKDLADEAKAKL